MRAREGWVASECQERHTKAALCITSASESNEASTATATSGGKAVMMSQRLSSIC